MKKFFYNISGIILISIVITTVSTLQRHFKGYGDVAYVIVGSFLGVFIFLIVSSIILLIGSILRKIASWFKK